LANREIREGMLSAGGHTASGFAAVYNTWTNIGGAFEERLAPGIFARSLREEPDVLALWSHKYDLVLGRTTSDTLRLFDEPKGLRFELDLDERTPDGARAIGTVDRGDVAGCSFQMVPVAETWEDNGIGLPRRTITEAYLFEITLTPIPAYPQTSVKLTSRSDNRANAYRRRAEAMRRRGISI
jgi:HK97 family phage prohead protease